jgi:hypothetical protein
MEGIIFLALVELIMKIVLGIILFLSAVFEGATPREGITNRSIVDSLMISVIAEGLEDYQNEIAESLAINVSSLDAEIRSYLKILAGNIATEKSFKVFRNYIPGSSFQGLVLTINLCEAVVIYSKPYEKSFLDENFVQRKIYIDIKGQLYSSKSERILKAIDKKVEYTDEIPYKKIAQLQNSSYSFCKGIREDYSIWDKLYEPALAITSVAIIVYLFFTQRT